MRLLGKQSSSDSADRVIALTIPCIIELLAQPGPAHLWSAFVQETMKHTL